MPEPLAAGHEYDDASSIPSAHRPEQNIWPIDSPSAHVRARRTAHSGSGTRWCATCNTSLKPDGRDKFCDNCTLRRNAERRAARRSQNYTVSPERLRRLHKQARTLDERLNLYLDNRETMDRTQVVLAVGQLTEAQKILISTINAFPDPDRRR